MAFVSIPSFSQCPFLEHSIQFRHICRTHVFTMRSRIRTRFRINFIYSFFLKHSDIISQPFSLSLSLSPSLSVFLFSPFLFLISLIFILSLALIRFFGFGEYELSLCLTLSRSVIRHLIRWHWITNNNKKLFRFDINVAINLVFLSTLKRERKA